MTSTNTHNGQPPENLCQLKPIGPIARRRPIGTIGAIGMSFHLSDVGGSTLVSDWTITQKAIGAFGAIGTGFWGWERVAKPDVNKNNDLDGGGKGHLGSIPRNRPLREGFGGYWRQLAQRGVPIDREGREDGDIYKKIIYIYFLYTTLPSLLRHPPT